MLRVEGCCGNPFFSIKETVIKRKTTRNESEGKRLAFSEVGNCVTLDEAQDDAPSTDLDCIDL